jgi:molybdopterin synthase catalytic subunit
MIRVEEQPFDASGELRAFRAKGRGGATAMFLGAVRDFSDERAVGSMTLERYPGMTEKSLAAIEAEARKRWPVDDVLIVHRYGRLEPGEDIVLVLTSSAHRDAAFDAARFLIDWLKTEAPFWKLESGPEGDRWVEAKESDDLAAARWRERRGG